MTGFFNTQPSFSLAAIQALYANANDIYINAWNEVNVTLAELNAYDTTALTEQTKFIVTDTTSAHTSDVTIGASSYPMWIKSESGLGVQLDALLTVSTGADDVIIDGFLLDGENSKVVSWADRTHITRSRFDGATGGGGGHWIEARSREDRPLNPEDWTGKDCEISYCEFKNYHNNGIAASTIFLFAYAENNYAMNHSLHHCFFSNYADNDNGAEPISMYSEREPGNWSSNKADECVLSTCKVYNNLFEDCHSDGELCKGGINGTHFYNNTILRCVGLLSFRYGYQQKMYNNYTDGEGITPAVGACAFSAPDCEAYDNIFIGIDNFSNYFPLKQRYPATDYSGGGGMKLERNYMKGGSFNLVLGDDTATGSDTTADVNATIVDNVFVQGVASAVVNFDANFGNEDILLSSGNTWYGTTLGEAITGFTEVLEEPPVPPYTQLTPADVGINADLPIDWVEDTTATMSTLASKVAVVTEPTKFVVSDEIYTSSITLTGNNYPVWIVAENLLGVNMQRPMYVLDSDIWIDGFKWTGWTQDTSNLYGIYVDAANCKILRCQWDDYQGRRWIEANMMSHELEIAYCDFRNLDLDEATIGNTSVILSYVDRDGSVSTTPQNTHIHHNYFLNIDAGATGHQALQIYCDEYSTENPGTNTATNVEASPMNNVIVEYNLFVNVDKTVEPKQNGCIIRYNTFDSCGTGPNQRLGTDGKIYGNTLLNVSHTATPIKFGGDRTWVFNNYIELETGGTSYGVGIQFRYDDQDTDYYPTLNDSIVAFNTIVNTYDYGCFYFVAPDTETSLGSPTGVIVANNICLPASGHNVSYNGWSNNADTSLITFSGNIYQESLGYLGSTGFDLADPQLTLQADGRRVPTSGSYCLGKADTSASTILDDIYGQTRPSPRAVGASEIVVTNTNPVLTSSDVGINA